MHRAGCDPEAMVAEDFLCDFCLRHWRPDLSMVEGHRGSLICAECLTLAYRTVFVDDAGIAVPQYASCALCHMHRNTEHLQSAQVDGSPIVCRPCIESSAKMLERDPSAQWSRPTKPGAAPQPAQAHARSQERTS
jgi:hypothetical protein